MEWGRLEKFREVWRGSAAIRNEGRRGSRRGIVKEHRFENSIAERYKLHVEKIGHAECNAVEAAGRQTYRGMLVMMSLAKHHVQLHYLPISSVLSHQILSWDASTGS